MADCASFDTLNQPDRVRALIGVANQGSGIDEKLSGRVNLNMFARLRRLSWQTTRQRTAELLDRFDLTDAADKAVRSYSGGMLAPAWRAWLGVVARHSYWSQSCRGSARGERGGFGAHDRRGGELAPTWRCSRHDRGRTSEPNTKHT
jgi:hypothetical protein